MITFACSTCQKKFSVKDELAGKEGKCPGCGQLAAIPSPVVSPATAEMATMPPLPGPASSRQDERTNALTHPPSNDLDATQEGNKPDPDHDASLTDFLAPAQANDELGRLGKYRVLKILGHGGMGVVFQAEDPRLQRKVAIKAMLPTLTANDGAGKRFLQEAQATAAVEHDHIVRIYQVDEEGGVPFLAMEFLKGEPLDERLKRPEKMPLGEVLRIGREIAEGLEAAHGTGLIHRDVKPANVWLEAPRGRVKILDFGLARAVSQDAGRTQEGTVVVTPAYAASGLTQQGAIVGTPAFMSPEQGRGEALDARSDLFSLGVVLYRLGTGQQPFQGKDAISTIMEVALHQPAPPIQLNAEIPQELSDLVMRLLEKDAARRPSSAAAVVEALEGLERNLSGQGKLRRRRLGVVLAAVLLLGGLIGVGAFTLIRFQSDQGNYVIDTDDPDFWFRVNKGVVTLEDRKTNRKYNLKVLRQRKATGEYELEVTDADAGLVFKTKTVTIKRGEMVALKAWFERKPASKQVEEVAAKLKERNPGFDGKVTYKVEGGVVTELKFLTDNVTDISPVRTLTGLQTLDCSGTWGTGNGQLADLTPLKDMKLTVLDCGDTQVSDLTPLKDMKLTYLNCRFTKVFDLTPLKDMKITELHCENTPVFNLTPLKDMKITELHCDRTKVADLSPLKEMKLTRLDCWDTQVTDLSPLKDMKLTILYCSGTKVNDLSPLKDMKLTELHCDRTEVADFSPLKDMKLTELHCWDTKVTDLSPLKDMKLTFLRCDRTQVSDLSPLRGMPLTYLECQYTPVFDLSPLKDTKLTYLDCGVTKVFDLTPLKDMKLTMLKCGYTKVADLSPLKDMKLTELHCQNTQVSDLSPLKDMKLTILDCSFTQVSDLSPLKDMKLTLLHCGATKVSDLSPLKDMKLTLLTCGYTKVADLSPLKDMKLTELHCQNTQVSDLTPLKDMKLTELKCGGTQVSDLTPLKDMKLTELHCENTPVFDLTPLKDMKLTELHCDRTKVADLSPLKDMKLTRLDCWDTKVADLSPLKGMPLKELRCDFKPERDADILRSLKTLENINGKPTKEFWKEVDAKKLEKKP